MLPSPPSPILLDLGPVEIRYYGAFILTGLLLAYHCARKLAHKRGLTPEIVDSFLLYGVFGGIIGARAYYVLFEWQQFQSNPLEAFAIWGGGLAIHGAILASIVVAILFCRIHRISFLSFADIGAMGLSLGQAFGRWGNYFNQEAFGSPTDLPWGIYIHPDHRPVEHTLSTTFHPTFFYESILNFCLFGLFYYLIRHRNLPHGCVFALYLLFYSLYRFFIESLRTDSLMIGSFRTAQLISILFVVVGIVLFRYCYKISK